MSASAMFGLRQDLPPTARRGLAVPGAGELGGRSGDFRRSVQLIHNVAWTVATAFITAATRAAV